ncbi:hypothetical protein GCM10010326_65950 [Streptomyces xanthochromogenes]|uniref:Transposase n=1 Tax=Streptomyces xanthochromogenes TaxID=67384 RepID=A0ABQ3APF9_9ACTN|nr:hypothetical protein GCM10010326_65950 [Streptomyces xanthochromogenes]
MVQLSPHSGQLTARPFCTASVRARVRRIRRHCRDRQADEQNTAIALAHGLNGSPHPRHNRGPTSRLSAATTSRSEGFPPLPMTSTYDSASTGQVVSQTP